MNTRRQLVLASASPSRLRILQDAGFDPTVRVSDADEDAYRSTALPDIVRELAIRKATAVAKHDDLAKDAIVIGCDSLFAVSGNTYGKPGTAAVARERWRMMAGKIGTLYTGHCVIDRASGRIASETASATVSFATPTAAEIDAYVATGEPIHVAGAFTLEGRASLFIDKIEGAPSTVIGLSIPTFSALLNELGIAAVDLWA